ncbi:30S ribosomal protein S9 [candidate division NPL-UPA2 bacterium]|nr:30S ribosomal protein S9 [candidate division NPL-UPA2 bacterium]
MADIQYCATGRRKESVAQVRLIPGEGKMVVNRRSLSQYFGRSTLEMLIKEPFQLTETTNKFDLVAKVRGGGLSGQAGAVRHGIARALLSMDEGLRPVLRRAGMLTRDPRAKERKKYGQKGARARFQFSKR